MQHLFDTEVFKKFQAEFNAKLNKHQKSALESMSGTSPLTVCMPTGTGKSMVIEGDIINHIRIHTKDVFCIATHRLMLNTQHFTDLFRDFSIVAGSIGYIFVGSSKIDIEQEDKDLNTMLKTLSLNYGDLFSHTISRNEIFELITKHKNAGRDVIIITTYNSIDKLEGIELHTLYCDEAHLLATEKTSSEFKSNYEKVKANRNFFFTATPRDLNDSEDAGETFLMNNKEIFGERIGLSFKEAIDNGYIVRPVVHVAQPKEYDKTKDYDSLKNTIEYITDIFSVHRNWVKGNSNIPDKIGPKLLIKCSEVAQIWNIYNVLVKKDEFKNINIFAGASKNGEENYTYSVRLGGGVEKPMRDKVDFLEQMKDVKDSDESIILHYDVLSEGINVPGITGVVFLSDILPTISKLLQNIGRSTRLFKDDRAKLSTGEISVNDLSKWIKPFCAVIVPIYNINSEDNIRKISTDIKNLRDSLGFSPSFVVSVGEDVSKSNDKADDLEALNQVGKKREPAALIGKINHYIENLEKSQIKSKTEDEYETIKNIQDPEEKKRRLIEFLNRNKKVKVV